MDAAAATGRPLEPLDTQWRAETPEGIALALRPAGIVPRFHAFAIDFAVRLAVVMAASMALSAFGRYGIGLFLLVVFLTEWFYPVLFELAQGGATLGKRALGLRVLMTSGLPITPAASLLRNLLRVADFLPAGYAFGALCLLVRSDFRRLGDLAAGTLVVHVHTPTLNRPLQANATGAPEAPARALTPREQAAVLAWASRIPRLTEARLDELALLAMPAIGEDASDRRDPSARLYAVALWLWGRR